MVGERQCVEGGGEWVKVFPLMVALLAPPLKSIPQNVFLIVFDLIVAATSGKRAMESPTFDSLFDCTVLAPLVSIPIPEISATVLAETVRESLSAKIPGPATDVRMFPAITPVEESSIPKKPALLRKLPLTVAESVGGLTLEAAIPPPSKPAFCTLLLAMAIVALDAPRSLPQVPHPH